MRNVSRAWAFETGLAAGVELGEGEQHTTSHFVQTLKKPRHSGERIL